MFMVSRTFPINNEGKPQTETIETKNGVDYTVNPNGVLYLMNGTAGGQINKPYFANASTKELYKYTGIPKRSTWAEFSVSGSELLVKVKNYDGAKVNVTHRWGIRKNLE